MNEKDATEKDAAKIDATIRLLKVCTKKNITRLCGIFAQHGLGVFPILKTSFFLKEPLNHPKISLGGKTKNFTKLPQFFFLNEGFPKGGVRHLG